MVGYSSSSAGKSKFWGYFIIVLFVALMLFFGFKKEKVLHSMKGALGCSKADIESTMIELIKEKPELIIQAVNDGQRAQQRKMIEEITKKVAMGMQELEKSTFTPLAGNPAGDVTIYYFYDPNCGYCKMSNATIAKLLADDKNLKVIYRPLPFLGQDSSDAVKVAVAVYNIDKSKYIDFHNKLMSGGRANKESALQAAQAIGITSDQINASLQKPENQAEVDQFMKLSADLGIRAVPGFVVNGDYIPGALDIENFKLKISEKRAELKKDEKK
jgi:protein-disulfide isomerase